MSLDSLLQAAAEVVNYDLGWEGMMSQKFQISQRVSRFEFLALAVPSITNSLNVLFAKLLQLPLGIYLWGNWKACAHDSKGVIPPFGPGDDVMAETSPVNAPGGRGGGARISP